MPQADEPCPSDSAAGLGFASRWYKHSMRTMLSSAVVWLWFDRTKLIVCEAAGREEGGADGGVVVQDCLELMNNLLRNNSSNQRMFRHAP